MQARAQRNRQMPEALREKKAKKKEKVSPFLECLYRCKARVSQLFFKKTEEQPVEQTETEAKVAEQDSSSSKMNIGEMLSRRQALSMPATWDRWGEPEDALWFQEDIAAFDAWVADQDVKQVVINTIELLENFPDQLNELLKALEEKRKFDNVRLFVPRLLKAIVNMTVVENLFLWFAAGIKPEDSARESIGIAMTAMGLYYFLQGQYLHHCVARGNKVVNTIQRVPVPGYTRLPTLNYDTAAAKEQSQHLLTKKEACFRFLLFKLESAQTVKTAAEKETFYRMLAGGNDSGSLRVG